MALSELVNGLKQAERQILKQLEGIRGAISSLEMGGGVSPAMRGRGPGRPAGKKKRTLSAQARAAISRAQKARWAKQKAAEKK